MTVCVHDQFTVPFGILDLDSDGTIQRLRLAHDEGQGVAAKVLQGLPGRDDAGITGDDDLSGSVVADDGPDIWKGQDLG
jgi:hypothetical protein